MNLFTYQNKQLLPSNLAKISTKILLLPHYPFLETKKEKKKKKEFWKIRSKINEQINKYIKNILF